jgi:hypothetical protein
VGVGPARDRHEFLDAHRHTGQRTGIFTACKFGIDLGCTCAGTVDVEMAHRIELGIELLDGVQEPDVSILDQVAQAQTVGAELRGHLHHETQGYRTFKSRTGLGLRKGGGQKQSDLDPLTAATPEFSAVSRVR